LPCIIDWNQIYFTHEEPFDMKDPFETYDAEVEILLKRLSQQPCPVSRQKRIRLRRE
jgi:hypothetical protein